MATSKIHPKLVAIAEKLEDIAGITPAPALTRDTTDEAALQRIEEAVQGGAFSAHDLGAHLDVTMGTEADGDFLRYSTAILAWQNATAALSDMTDISFTAPASGRYLRHNGTNWTDATISVADLPSLTGVLALDDLSDVVITTPAQRNYIYYNTGSSRWLNGTHYIGQGHHADLSISTPATGKVIRYGGAIWQDSYLDLNDLGNVTTAGASVRQVLTYDGISTWQPEYTQLANLGDVNVSTIGLPKEVLYWDVGTNRWKNAALNTLPLYGDWDMGDYDITADAFLSNMNVSSSQHTNFVATNNVAATATAGGTIYRGMYINFDYAYNGVFTTDTAVGLQLDYDFTLTAGFNSATMQVIDVNCTWTSAAPILPAWDFRATASNSSSTFGGATTYGAMFVQATAGGVGFTAIRSEAVASSASAAATDSANGYLGYSSGANTYTGNLVGVRGFTATVTGANGTWAIMGTPATSGTINQNRKVAIGGVGGHFYANGGSMILESSAGSTFRRPADVSTTHLNFNTNYGELYVQGASEFDGTAHFDGDIDHNGTNVGFYSIAPTARPSAYTQTYATATRTHAALTAAALTDSTGGTANTTLVAIAGTGDDANINDNFADLAAQCNALLTDLTNVKQVLNQVLDDFQLNGLLQ